MTATIPNRPSRCSDAFDPATAQTSACTGKQGFGSWAEANRIIKARQRSARSRASGKQAKAERAVLTPYRCRHCHRWHISGSKG